MKRTFTLIELIIVIVIMGILSTITFDIVSKLYTNYLRTKELNALSSRTDYALNVISGKMRSRIKNSVIATEINSSTYKPIDFKSIQDLKGDDTKYTALEWINQDYESKHGIYLDNLHNIQTGWSGFADLDTAVRTNDNPKEFNISFPDSNFTIVSEIDKNVTGFSEDVFDNNVTVIIFSGNDGRGDLNDINHSYGWYRPKAGNKAQKVFRISQYYTNSDNDTEVNITAIDDDNDSTLYEQYFLAHTAYSIVPKKTPEGDYNLSFYYNYQPWRDQNYTDANETLLATNVTEFKFRESAGVVRIYLCIQSPETTLGDSNLTICKERVIF